MEDHEIINLYWKRDEAAIQETNYKYGRFCHSIAINILTVPELAGAIMWSMMMLTQ